MKKDAEVGPEKGWLELEDDLVTAADLEAAIAERIQSKPPAEDVSFPVYTLVTEPPDFPVDIPYRYGLYYHLQQANEHYNQAETQPQLAPSPATQLPFLGRLWAFIREEAHRLVLFYVNRNIGHQTQVNRHVVQTLNELTRQIEEQQRQIQGLQARLQGDENNETMFHQDG